MHIIFNQKIINISESRSKSERSARKLGCNDACENELLLLNE